MPKNKKINYKVIERKIKYPRLEFKTGELVVIAPSDGDFDAPKFISKHIDWIQGKQSLIKKYSRKKVSLRRLALAREDLRSAIYEFIEKYAAVVKVNPKRIIIKEMKSKWGSCSVSKNLCFNLLLGRLPDSMIEYVVYHEMCHLRQRKHNGNFKVLLKKYFSSPEKMEEKLFHFWFAVKKDL